MRVSEIRVKRIRVNQGLGVHSFLKNSYFSIDEAVEGIVDPHIILRLYLNFMKTRYFC